MIPYIGRDQIDKNTVMYSNRMIVFRNELLYHVEKCIDCGLCIPTCPKLAIFEPTEEDFKKKLSGPVEVNTELCIYCGICDYLCPTDAFEFTTNKERKLILRENGSLPELRPNKIIKTKEGIEVKRYLKGNLILNADKCPDGCDKCLVCPTDVFEMTGKKVSIKNKDNCFYCFACTKACPVSDALKVTRSQILYNTEDIFSSPFSEIINILISPVGKAKHLKEFSKRKSIERIKELYGTKYEIEE
ncbi:MAG: 4Fe-4S dicluster domain-containing protein [Candidatus Lokiarchaeota archaeon]|nr:4Fe-4S dicluster domain-containing protein [Candidatus Lokiarchaeota archaeon]